MSPPAYAELHCLSNFTFLRGASHPEELVEQADALGYRALAITDECSVAGVVRAAWSDFTARQRHRGAWNAGVDRRSGLVEIAEGAGVPWVPGHGNRLELADVADHLGVIGTGVGDRHRE